MAPTRGRDRTGRARRCPATVALVAAGVVVAVATTGAGVAGGPHTTDASGAGPATAAATAGSALTLLAPPTIAEPASPFSLRLGLPAGPRAGFTLAVTVFGPVSDTTEFGETLGGSPVESVVSGPFTVPLSSLPPDPGDPQGAVDLTVAVTAAGVTSPGTGPFTVALHCSLGSCGGVYPVRLELVDTATGSVTARLLTYLVYTDPAADIERLRFALVVPVDAPTSSTSLTGAPLPSPSLTALTALMGSLGGPRASVALSVAPTPAVVAALGDDSRPRAKTVLASLVAMAATPGRQTLCDPFVAVNADALVSDGLGAELGRQIQRGAQVLDTMPGLKTAGCTSGVWVANSGLDGATLGALAFLGYPDVVVPPDGVSGPAPLITPTRRFTLAGSTRTGDAVLSDSDLAALLKSASTSDPALTADQILAELELYYYEAQNTPAPRGVVAVTPSPDGADPAVITDVLNGLLSNPMVQPVTLATLFSNGPDGVPVGGTVGGFVQPSVRRALTTDGSAAALPVRAIKAARQRWNGLSSALSASSAGTDVAIGLDDLLLEAESDRLSASGQRAALARFDRDFSRQKDLLSITSRQVRLTAQAGNVPITVIKNTPYPVAAVLTVTSDKITFAPGGAQPANAQCRRPVVTSSASQSSVSSLCTFVQGTNQIYVNMRSRVSGDFVISVTLHSPAAGLPLATAQLTVRSMSTSAVAVILSAGAGAVLLGWWGRTFWRNRRSRRAAHRRGANSRP